MTIQQEDTQNAKWQHWQLELMPEQNIVKLGMYGKNSSLNVLSKEVLLELKQILHELKTQQHAGLMIYSLKPGVFIAGADVHEFVDYKTAEQALAAIQFGQGIMDDIENLPFPSIAVIDGFCLGGGLELALACSYRISSDAPEVKLGLPEVKLGIHPGFGGSVRSIRRMGLIKAMQLMLSGRNLSAQQAYKQHLIEAYVPRRHLFEAALKLLIKQPKVKLPRISNALLKAPIIQSIVHLSLRHQVRKHAHPEHYPAPYALLRLWREHGHHEKHMLSQEAISASQLLLSESAQNLIRVFHLQERLKQLGRAKGEHKIQQIHVVGAGAMGADIAMWSVYKGFSVSLYDRNQDCLVKAMHHAKAFFKKRSRSQRAYQQYCDNLLMDVDNRGIGKADLIIEAIIEKVEAKQWVFKEAEEKAKAQCIFATNTSAIPLDEISSVLKRPERLVGLHFFNPVALMPLVEVVSSPLSKAEIVQSAMHFTSKLGKLPLPVASSPGFLVNRILMPYLLEAMQLFEEGINPEKIDRAARDFGMPMGPLELADSVGLDICYSVAQNLSQSMNISVPETLKQMIERNHLGKKTGHGFYHFHHTKPVKHSVRLNPLEQQEIRERLLFRMLNESVDCLNDKVVENSDLLDAGVIFGTGFAPFRGGPLHYIYQQGIELMDNKLVHLSAHYGRRFKPVAGWHNLSASS